MARGRHFYTAIDIVIVFFFIGRVIVLLIGEHFWTATGEHYYTAIDNWL